MLYRIFKNFIEFFIELKNFLLSFTPPFVHLLQSDPNLDRTSFWLCEVSWLVYVCEGGIVFAN